MILYHTTRIKNLASIAREGLWPHVPGVVWDGGEPAVARLTHGRPVVWLTADGSEWRHDRHEERISCAPDTRRLSVRLEPNNKRLMAYWPWLQKHDLPAAACVNRWRAEAQLGLSERPDQNVPAWFVYFGTIPPDKIVDGLEREQEQAA